MNSKITKPYLEQWSNTKEGQSLLAKFEHGLKDFLSGPSTLPPSPIANPNDPVDTTGTRG